MAAYGDMKSAQPRVAYLCDRRACGLCSSVNPCRHTLDIRHAQNFELFGGHFMETERSGENQREQVQAKEISTEGGASDDQDQDCGDCGGVR